MSFSDIVAMVEDWDLRMRLAACAATEQPDDPVAFTDRQAFRLCAQPGWDTAWAAAAKGHAGDDDYRPGADPAVITDTKIRTAVLAVLADLATRAGQAAQAAQAAHAEQLAAEEDRAFAAHVRMRRWEIDNIPAIPEPRPTPTVEPEDTP